MEKLVQTVAINRDTMRVFGNAGNSNANSNPKKCGIQFEFDAVSDCSIQLIWGLTDNAWRNKILSPFRMESEGNNLTAPSVITHQPFFNIHDALDSDDYLAISEPKVFGPGLAQKYKSAWNELYTEEECDMLFTALPVPVSNDSDSDTESEKEAADGSSEQQEDKLAETNVIREANVDPFLRIPLIIVAKTISSPEEKEFNGFAGRDAEEEKSLYVYSFVYFTRFSCTDDQSAEEDGDSSEDQNALLSIHDANPNAGTNGASHPSIVKYATHHYRQVIQTARNIYLAEDVYGTDQDDPNSSEECVICLCEDREITLLPCRHLCVCEDCFTQISKCPICRKHITSFVLSKSLHDDHNMTDDECTV